MKKVIFVFIFFNSFLISAQKKDRDIIRSTNISDIENFLKTAHPEDPRRYILKSKLIALKNAAWMNQRPSAKPVVQLQLVQIPKSVLKLKQTEEALEFQKLISENKDVHKDKTVKLLNQLFDNQVDSKEAILLFQNKSDCNMVLRIQGNEFYNLAVPAKGENFIVLKKGDYSLSGNVCDASYSSNKSIKKHTLVMLNNTGIQNFATKNYQVNSGNPF